MAAAAGGETDTDVDAAGVEVTMEAEVDPEAECPEFCCALCLGLLRAPITLPCGHSFCRAPCLSRALEVQRGGGGGGLGAGSTLSSAHCPLCRRPCLPSAATHGEETRAISEYLLRRFPDYFMERQEEEAKHQEQRQQQQQQHAAVHPEGARAAGAALAADQQHEQEPRHRGDGHAAPDAAPVDGAGGGQRVELPVFFLHRPEGPLFPYQPQSLIVFEQRYILLVQRLLSGGDRRFVLHPTAAEGEVGTVVELQSAHQVRNGQFVAQLAATSRCRFIGAPRAEENSMGLHHSTVDIFVDADNDTVDRDPEEAVARVAPRLLRLVQKFTDWLDFRRRHEVRARFGDVPTRGQWRKLSFWLASAMRLTSDQRRQLYLLESANERLLRLATHSAPYLERHVPEDPPPAPADQAAQTAGAAAAAGGGPAGAAAVGAAAATTTLPPDDDRRTADARLLEACEYFDLKKPVGSLFSGFRESILLLGGIAAMLYFSYWSNQQYY